MTTLDEGHDCNDEFAESIVTAITERPRRSARWYSKIPPEDDSGCACVLTEHRTKGAAERAAAEVLEDGSEGWPEDVDSIEWGILVPIARASEYERVEDPSGEFDYLAKYRLDNVPPLTRELRASGPLSRDEQELMSRLADEITGLICGGICPSMVDVETLARLAARAAESDGV